MQVFAAKYQNHLIVLKNTTLKEQLLVDGKVVAESKAGLRLGTCLIGELPMEDKSVLMQGNELMLNQYVRRAYVGNVLEAQKTEKKEWTVEHEGHVFKFVNAKYCEFYIDDQLIDRSEERVEAVGCLGGNIPGTNTRAVMLFDGLTDTSGLVGHLHVYFIVDAQRLAVKQYKREGGEYIPVNDSSIAIEILGKCQTYDSRISQRISY